MKISIVIPVYNEAELLGACLDSIARQTLMPNEVLVIDNNSSDDSTKIARQYPFVRVVREPRQGRVYAQKRGFDVAKGDVICRIDADTRLPVNWVRTVAANFTDPGLAALTGQGEFYGVRAGKFWGRMQVVGYQKFQRLIAGTYFLWGSNMAIRKQAWLAVRNRCSDRTDIDEDIDLSLCLKDAKLPIKFDPDLQVAASLLRGRYDPVRVARYLMTWPKDYLIHGRYIGAVATLLFSSLAVLVAGLIWSVELLLSRSQGLRRSRRHWLAWGDN